VVKQSPGSPDTGLSPPDAPAAPLNKVMEAQTGERRQGRACHLVEMTPVESVQIIEHTLVWDVKAG